MPRSLSRRFAYFTRLVRLSYLAPDLTQAILDRRQPRDLMAECPMPITAPLLSLGGSVRPGPAAKVQRFLSIGMAQGRAHLLDSMIQLAWRFLMFQKNSALAQWYRRQTADSRGTTRKTMIVALARKLLVALWQLVTTGEMPEGVVLRAAA